QAALDLQAEALTAWLNGARSASPRGPAGIASWFSPGPYGIHATADGHLAVSLAAPSLLAKALDVPELAGFSEKDSFAKREAITRSAASYAAPRRPEGDPQCSTSPWLTTPGSWLRPSASSSPPRCSLLSARSRSGERFLPTSSKPSRPRPNRSGSMP